MHATSTNARRDPYIGKETLIREKRPLSAKRDPYSQKRDACMRLQQMQEGTYI